MTTPSASDIVTAALAQGQLPEEARSNISRVVATLEQQLASTSQNVQHLQAALSQQPPPPVPIPPAVFRLKPPKPAPFKGGGKERVGEWLKRLNAFFGAHPPMVDVQKINYAAACLEGVAAKWWSVHCEDHLRPGATYESFSEALHKRFTPPNLEQRARDKLLSVRQTSTVAAYTERFLDLSLDIPGLDVSQALHQYIFGLKPEVKTDVLLRHPPTLAEAITLADESERTRQDGMAADRVPGRHPPNSRFRPRYPPHRQYGRSTNPPASHPVPMELGAAHAPPKRSPLTPQEREYLRTHNGCFYCRRTGHTRDHCPEWKARYGQHPSGNGRRAS